MNSQKNNDAIIYFAVIGAVAVVLILFVVMLFSGSDTDLPRQDVPITDDAQISDTADPSVSEAPTTVPATDTADTSIATSPSAPTVTAPEEWDPLLAETADAGQGYLDKLVFLGDSTTYGLRYYEKLSGGKSTAQVWTPESGTLALFNISTATIVYPETGEPLTIKDALTRKQPEYLVITLGVNGIATLKENEFKIYYKWLLDAVKATSPNTKIICQTMFPVASNYANLNTINNDKIRTGNQWILEIASENNVKFIDTYSCLVGEDGWLPSTLQNGDGLHLNSEGFDIELQNLRTHAYLD